MSRERLRLWLERGERGFFLRDAVTNERVRWEDPRLRVVPVAGVSFRAEALDDRSFDPGRPLSLVREPDNEYDPSAVGTWNEERTLQLGYVPAAVAGKLAGDERAISLLATRRRAARPARTRSGVGRRPSVGSAAVAYEFKLPDLGEGLTEGEVARWLVSEGQEVGEDDPLVEIQTDKTTVEIPSPAAGKVARILVAEGQTVPVGTVLVVIGADGSRPGDTLEPRSDEAPPRETAAFASEAAPALRPGSAGRARATPLVRRLAQALGVELESLQGSGPQGRVTEADVRGAVSSARLAPEHASEGRREPLRGVRKLIAEHMARAQREVPAVTWVEECDFGNIDLRRLVPLALKACAEALREFPELNARLEGDEIVYLDRYDLGLAVQTEQGLVVPVVRGCDTASVDELAAEVARLAEAARAGKLEPQELRGSTFTVTSAGKLAGLFQTPIVNHPEVGILSIGRVSERPLVREGEIVVRPIGTIAVTFDHRVVDGTRAAEFGLSVIARLEKA